MSLTIADDLVLGDDYITKVCAIVAQRRKGKTYTASLIAEEMVAAGLPWVALDPTGAWWGLRSSADGRSAGLPVIVLGGAHGHAPLGSHMGAMVADLVLDHPGWYVIDLSGFDTRAEERRFSYEFADRLYRRKGGAGMDFPLHLFVDEADMFAPQEKETGDLKMLGAFQAIVRRGGLRGLGVTLITQRPALLNKSVLTQLDMLILLRLVAGNDQDAVDDNYIKRQATKELRAALMGSMAGLAIGEGWVWEPGAEPTLLLRTHFRQRRTFNSSATPKPGEVRIEPSVFADVDLAGLMAAFEEEIIKAERDDPDKLRGEIARLEAHIADLEARPATPVEIVPPWLAPKLRGNLEAIETAVQAAYGLVVTIDSDRAATVEIDYEAIGREIEQDRLDDLARAVLVPQRVGTGSGDDTVTPAQRKLMTALVQHGPLPLRRLAVLTGLQPTSKYVSNLVSAMRTKGWVEPGQPVTLTDEGAAALGSYEPLPAGQDLVAWWLNEKLTDAQAKVLRAYIAIYPRGMTPRQAAERTGLDPDSKYISNLVSAMRSLGVLEGQGAETRVNQDLMEDT